MPDGTPFLISPALEYDIDLNRYFLAPAMAGAAQNTRLAAMNEALGITTLLLPATPRLAAMSSTVLRGLGI